MVELMVAEFVAVAVESVVVAIESLGSIDAAVAASPEDEVGIEDGAADVIDADAIFAAGSEKTPVDAAVIEVDEAVSVTAEEAVSMVELKIEDVPLVMVLGAMEVEFAPFAPGLPSSSSSSSESEPSSSRLSPSSSSSESPPSSVPESSPLASPVSLPVEAGTTALREPADATIGAAGVNTRVTFLACENEFASNIFAEARDDGVSVSAQSSSRVFTMS